MFADDSLDWWELAQGNDYEKRNSINFLIIWGGGLVVSKDIQSIIMLFLIQLSKFSIL